MDQNETILPERFSAYAGFWHRFGAIFIDGIILSIAGYVLKLIFKDPAGITDMDFFNNGFDFRGYIIHYYTSTAGILNVIMGWLYFALLESGAGQATIGKRALGIKVTDVNGNRISFGRATGRYFAKIISNMTLLIGYLMVFWDRRHQALHDKIAETMVVMKD